MVKPALAEPQFPTVILAPVAAYLKRRHRNTYSAETYTVIRQMVLAGETLSTVCTR